MVLDFRKLERLVEVKFGKTTGAPYAVNSIHHVEINCIGLNFLMQSQLKQLCNRFIFMTKTCVKYCRIGNTEYLPGTDYRIEFNPVDYQLRIYDVWGCQIVSGEFINANFI